MNIKSWQIAGLIFTILFGSLLHFTYEWSDNNPLVGIFSAVNESTWEHLKLLFIPMFLFFILEFFAYGNEYPNFIIIKFCSMLLGMVVIVAAFYTYSGILGQNFLWADILIFILGVLSSYLFTYIFLQTDCFVNPIYSFIGLLGIIGLLICFFIFTFNPPQLPFFQDPISLKYGIAGSNIEF